MKITQEREKCIGCGTCVAVCPDFWVMNEDGKSDLKGAKDAGNGIFELEADDVGCNKDASSACPVQIIHVK
jgi:ferredoxin